MRWLLCTARDLEELARLNACHDDRQIAPLPSDAGEMLVSSEFVGDEYWIDYAEWLDGLSESPSRPAGVLG